MSTAQPRDCCLEPVMASCGRNRLGVEGWRLCLLKTYHVLGPVFTVFTYYVPGPMLAFASILFQGRDLDPDWGTLASFTFQGLVSAD